MKVLWNSEQARAMAKRGNEAKARIRAAQREASALASMLASEPTFHDRTKARLRAQAELIMTRIEEEAAKPKADGSRLDRLAAALDRILEQERLQDGRPLPGSRRPPREDPPSAKPAPRALPVPQAPRPPAPAINPPPVDSSPILEPQPERRPFLSEPPEF